MDDVFEEVYYSVFNSIENSISALHDNPAEQETITRLLHSIKSPAASLGAEQMERLAATYEYRSRNNELEDLNLVVTNLNKALAELKDSLLDFEPTE